MYLSDNVLYIYTEPAYAPRAVNASDSKHSVMKTASTVSFSFFNVIA